MPAADRQERGKASQKGGKRLACSLCFVVHFHGGAGIVAKKGTRYPHTHNGDDATVDRPHRGSDRVLVYGVVTFLLLIFGGSFKRMREQVMRSRRSQVRGALVGLVGPRSSNVHGRPRRACVMHVLETSPRLLSTLASIFGSSSPLCND